MSSLSFVEDKNLVSDCWKEIILIINNIREI